MCGGRGDGGRLGVESRDYYTTEQGPMVEAGSRILIVEDHQPLARFVALALTTAGWTVCGPLCDLPAALAAARQWPLDVAVIDRSLAGDDTHPVVDALIERGVACLLLSGYPRTTLPSRFRTLPFVEKPFTMEQLVAA